MLNSRSSGAGTRSHGCLKFESDVGTTLDVSTHSIVITGLDPVIHVLLAASQREEVVDGRGIGERSDAVLQTAMPGHDEQ